VLSRFLELFGNKRLDNKVRLWYHKFIVMAEETATPLISTEDQWFETLRNYYLGYDPECAILKHLSLSSYVPKDLQGKDREIYEARFAKEIAPLMVNAEFEKTITNTIELVDQGFVPQGRQFIMDLSVFEERKLNPFVTKFGKPDNCIIRKYGTNWVYDVKCYEESGLVRIGDCCITRTVQPYLMIGETIKGKEEVSGMLPANGQGGVLCVVPAMDEETFGEKMPYVPSMEHLGIQFTGTFEIFPINEAFRTKYGLSTTAMFILRGYKKKLDMYKKLPPSTIPRDFYRDIVNLG